MLMPLLVDEVLLKQPGFLVTQIDSLFPVGWHGPVLYILSIMALTLLLRFSGTLLSVWQTREFTLIGKDITFRLRADLLQRLQTISMAEYETLGSGAVASHLVTDIDTIDSFIGNALSKFVVAVLIIIGVAITLLWIHWQLALFILIMNPIVIYFTTVLGKKVKHLKKQENSAVELFQQSLTETLDAIQQIRASNRERHYLLRVIDRARGVQQSSASFSWKSDAANRLSFFIFLMGFEVFRAVSMLMVVFSSLSIGQMFAVYAYLWFMMTPVQEILSIQYSYFSANAALQRLNRLLGLQQEPLYPANINPFSQQTTASLRIADIHFSYTQGEAVLDGVSLTIQAGEKIALVGASGGGKSTLIQVILGLYPAAQGQIYFNEVPITQIGLATVRENIATVLQQPALFNDSIRNNLTMGRQIDDQQLWQALEIAQLKQTIQDQPATLDTIVGRNGIRLSGGQRQRLAIARMILTNPKIVILDEATSALDTATEEKLHQALGRFLQGRTTLIIAHRLSAIKQADRAYVFDGGKIIDQGQHGELLQRDGLYQQLYGERQQ
ncbi:MAG: ABC transporter ATP-binding protein [Gammaproteobacteria bacterium]|nr:ABC transporter ATP-binding protein [Gammaproteobacteria bacterium]MBL6999201.1 ABC transporter ATP-binding protein [Gammaproteobacteria bacterium]